MLAPQSNADDWFLFPSGLFGSQRNVRRFCEDFVTRVLDSGCWDAVPVSSRESVIKGDTDILIFDSRLIPRNTKCCRLYCLHEAWDSLTCSNISPDVVISQTLRGMDNLWFTLTMIMEFQLASLFRNLGWNETRDRFFLPALERVVHWLPEIWQLRDRLVAHLNRELEKHFAITASLPSNWMIKIAVLCEWCGYSYPLPLNDVEYSDNLIEAMLDRGIIARAGDRFTLNK